MKKIFASFVFLLCTAFALQAQTTWFVTPGAPTTGTGQTWADPIDFQTGINAASDGDSVFVAQGTYQPASGQSFTMKEGVKIYGGFAGTEGSLDERHVSAGHISTLTGNNTRVIFNNNNGLTEEALLDGFTIINGSYQNGGGMYNNVSSPTVSNCIFTGNIGGGMWNGNSSTTVINCAFLGNTGSAFGPGGIGCASNNGASNGVSIINCIFWGNTGYRGSAIYTGNLGPVSPKIINCTFLGNVDQSNTSGTIYCDAESGPQIQNCIIWGNSTGLHLAGHVYSPQIITNNIIQGGYLRNFHADPLFVNDANPAGADNIFGTADDGLKLQPRSPALNTGTTGNAWSDNDITGAARIQDNRVDMGAYECSFTCPAFTTLYVDSSVSTSGDGGSWATAFKTPGEALTTAYLCNNVDNIWIAAGTYRPTAGNVFSMVARVKIYGGFPAGGGSFAQRNPAVNKTILQGNGFNTPIIYNTNISKTAVLDGFTINGGTCNFGGGMYNNSASPTINNCVFSGNIAYSGGGSGAGMYNQTSNPVISNCIFSGNTTIDPPTGDYGGGAIYNGNSSPTISNCIFTGNTGGWGGAIYNKGASSSRITNSVFDGNTASKDGGAIVNYYNSSLTLTNVTFVNNYASRGGGAVENWTSTLAATNTLFWGNTAVDNQHDMWWSTGGTGSVNHSFTQTTWAGTGNILGSSSPFVNAALPAGADGIWGTADDGLILKSGSPCINTGIPDTTGLRLGNTDLAGNPRIVNAVIDMGAYEYNTALLPVHLISFTGTLHNGVANLQWNTDMETNFNHFVVEKSKDGALFQSQGEVSAKGNLSRYTYNTLQEELTAWYRLKLVDNDGSAVYSRSIRLSQNAGSDNDMLVYPNPATDYINIKVVTAGTMRMYAADGQLIKTLAMKAGVNVVDVSTLSAGVYYGVMNGMQTKLIKK